MKKQVDVHLIVNKKLGKPVRDRLYLTEKNAIKEFQYYNQDAYSLCKYSVTAVLEDGEWVDVPEQAE